MEIFIISIAKLDVFKLSTKYSVASIIMIDAVKKWKNTHTNQRKLQK